MRHLVEGRADLRLAAVLCAVLCLSCETGASDRQSVPIAGRGDVQVSRAALSQDGLVVRLTPGNISANGETWSDPVHSITFTAGAGTTKPAVLTSGLGNQPAMRFSGGQYMTAALGDTSD